jgi:hypothetical protein
MKVGARLIMTAAMANPLNVSRESVYTADMLTLLKVLVLNLGIANTRGIAAVDRGVVMVIAAHLAIGVAYGTMTAALDGGAMRIIITSANKTSAKKVTRRKKASSS